MSILVDTSVWINHFRNVETPAVGWLRQTMATRKWELLGGDLIALEVLRGCRSDAHALKVEQFFDSLAPASLAGLDECVRAATLYRKLRSHGITMSKAVDLLIASWCIKEDIGLLQEDKDFQPLEPFGLRLVALA